MWECFAINFSLNSKRYLIPGKYKESQMKCTEAYRIVQEQKELITQLEADVMNIRSLPSSLYRGEGVGAPTPSPDTEAMTKAVQGFDLDISKRKIINIYQKCQCLFLESVGASLGRLIFLWLLFCLIVTFRSTFRVLSNIWNG